MTNHYATLRLSPTATDDGSRAPIAGRLARHIPTLSSSEAFHTLAAAYEVLSDPMRRRSYDTDFQHWLKSVGAMACGAMRRGEPRSAVSRRAARRCGGRRKDLAFSEQSRRAAAREALVYQAATVVDDVGGEMLAMAHEALRIGLGRLRYRWGLGRAVKHNDPTRKRVV